MGADLIGYFAKGPEKLVVTKKKRRTISDELIALRDWLRPLMLRLDGETGDVAIETIFTEEVMQACPAQLGPVDEDDLRKIWGWLNVTGIQINALVDVLISNWPPTFRDSSWMKDPDDPEQIMAFCGEMSWGDPPDGGGFEYLEQLGMLGVGTHLGIRVGCSFVTIRLNT